MRVAAFLTHVAFEISIHSPNFLDAPCTIFVTFLKSSRLELINVALELPANETGVDLSLIDLIDLLGTEEKLKNVKLILM
jgi:hypothetical protein